MESFPLAHAGTRPALGAPRVGPGRRGAPALPAGLRWLPALLLAATVRAEAQPGIPDDFRDSLVLRLAAVRTPCPDPPPAAWAMVDSTLGRAPRCSLLESAAQLVRQRLVRRPSPESTADPWRPLCVRLVVLDNMGSTGMPGDWLVIFDLMPGLSAEVVIDRRSGSPSLVLFGDGVRRWGPPCVERRQGP